MTRMVWTIFLAMLFAGTVLAGDPPYLPGPSWRGEPGTVAVSWDNWPGPPDHMWPDGYMGNPGGLDTFYADGIYTTEVLSDWQGRQNVLKIGGGVRFYLDNYDDPQPMKRIRVQITYDSDHSQPLGFGVQATYEGGDVYSEHEAVLVDSIDPDAFGWITAAYEFILEPNPLSERIGVAFGLPEYGPGGTAYVDEVIIDTWCTVPEPATVGLLVLGGLVMLKRRG